MHVKIAALGDVRATKCVNSNVAVARNSFDIMLSFFVHLVFMCLFSLSSAHGRGMERRGLLWWSDHNRR